MKNLYFISAIFLFVSGLTACNFSSDTRAVNTDSLRADSIWKVAIADSIYRARGGDASPTVNVNDTSATDIESISRGIEEGLNKVQDGLNKVRKVTEVSSNSSKAITDGINKTKEAVNKTIEEARRAVNGEPKPQP